MNTLSRNRQLQNIAVLAVAALFAAFVMADPPGAPAPCSTCPCKYVDGWKNPIDNYAQGLRSNNAILRNAMANIESHICPNPAEEWDTTSSYYGLYHYTTYFVPPCTIQAKHEVSGLGGTITYSNDAPYSICF